MGSLVDLRSRFTSSRRVEMSILPMEVPWSSRNLRSARRREHPRWRTTSAAPIPFSALLRMYATARWTSLPDCEISAVESLRTTAFTPTSRSGRAELSAGAPRPADDMRRPSASAARKPSCSKFGCTEESLGRQFSQIRVSLFMPTTSASSGTRSLCARHHSSTSYPQSSFAAQTPIGRSRRRRRSGDSSSWHHRSRSARDSLKARNLSTLHSMTAGLWMNAYERQRPVERRWSAAARPISSDELRTKTMLRWRAASEATWMSRTTVGTSHSASGA